MGILPSLPLFPSAVLTVIHSFSFSQGERTVHIWIAVSLKKDGYLPVNNACAVPACVTVSHVLSSSIGESAGESRIVNE